jgi:Leu/Phe-tRNA-protein transferase
MKFGIAFTAAVAAVVAGCAQQQPSPAAGGMSGMSMQGHDMAGMPGHDMGGTDMQTMMQHCAQMRQQAAQGALSPEMQQMMTHCNQMDRQMGGGTSGMAPMPNATRSR